MELINTPIHIGSSLPELSLQAYDPIKDDIVPLDLHSYRGKWMVLFFYPADFTFVCPTELVEYAEMFGEFEKEGAVVISTSTDTAFAHKAWHDTSDSIKQVKYMMAADPTGTLARAFGVYIESEGLALRGTFIVDPDGILRTMEVHDNSIGRSAKESLRKLRAAKFVREHGGNVCPAAWEPGEETLRPDIKLVGKI